MLSFEMNQLHLIATILFTLILEANAFSYKDAKNWGDQYPGCKGKNQSPVLFKSPGMMGYTSISPDLTLTDFKKLPKKLTIKNTGHTVEVKANWDGKTPTVTGGPLNGNYVFEKATFHWARKRWDEAQVDKDSPFILKSYLLRDLEMHVFFYKADLKSFEKAETQKGGLAVFNIGFASGYDNPERSFDDLEKNLHKVQSINSKTKINPFRLLSLVEQLPPFDFYEGSLDYPPCSESVTWFIFYHAGGITDNLLKGFRKVKLAEGDVSNVRPFQAANKRQLKTVSHSGFF